MKINQKQLNEMIRHSILKTLSENRMNEDIQTVDLGDDDYGYEDEGDEVDTTSQPQQDNTAERIKNIEDFYNTTLYTADGKDKNATRRKKIKEFLGRIDLKTNTAYGMARNLVNGDYLLTDANGAPLMPWNYDINTGLTILTKNIKPEGINNLLNAFEKTFGNTMAKFKLAVEKSAQKKKDVENKPKRINTKGVNIPTKQVEYRVEESNGRKFCIYNTDENGELVMNENFPNISVFKVYPTELAKRNPQLLQQAYDDLEEAWEEINDYTIYDPGNEKYDFQNLARHELGDKILKTKDYHERGKHPFDGSDTHTIDKWGSIRYWDKDSGEEIFPGNQKEIEQYWGPNLAKFHNLGKQDSDNLEKQDSDNLGQENINEERVRPKYYDEEGNLTLDKPLNSVDAFNYFNDTDEFFATYPVRDGEGNILHMYVISNEQLKPRDMLRHLRSIVVRKYQEAETNTKKLSQKVLEKDPSQIVPSDYLLFYYREDRGQTLCWVEYLNGDAHTPLEVIPEEDIRSTFLTDWKNYYGRIAINHNKEIEEEIGSLSNRRSMGYNNKNSNAGMTSIYTGNVNESTLIKMIIESIKRNMK